MATGFPTTLDALSNPASTDNLDAAGLLHDQQHADQNDALEALQAKAGVTGSAVTTSLDYIAEHVTECFIVPGSDETTPLVVSDGLKNIRFVAPYRFWLDQVKGSVSTAPTGNDLVVQLRNDGSAVLADDITIAEFDTTTDANPFPPTIRTGWEEWFEGDVISIDIDQIGSTSPGTGLKVYLYVHRIGWGMP